MKVKTTLLIFGLLEFLSFSSHAQGIKTFHLKERQLGNISVDTLRYKLNDTLRSKDTCRPDMEDIRNYLLSGPFIVPTGRLRTDALISDLSFFKLIRRDFSKTILGADNVSKIARYASLDVSDKPAFDFTPLTWELNKDIYKDILGLNISGKLGGDGFFEVKDYRDLTLKASWVHLLNRWTNYKAIDSANNLKSELMCDLTPGIKKLCSTFDSTFQHICTCYAKPNPRGKKREGAVDAFIEAYTDLEVETVEPYWKSKHFFWFSINLGLKRDKFKFISDDSLQAKSYAPISETVFTPQLSGSINLFHQSKVNLFHENRDGFSYLASISAALKQKHSLSEVYEPDEFQSFYQVNDSVLQLNDLESVFVTDFTSIDRKFTFDYGARFVLMSPYLSENRKQQIGVSYSFNRIGLVYSSTYPSLFRSELGIIFPFLNSEDESDFNLELFSRWDTYSNFPNANEHIWGLRFNVPISSTN